MTEGYQKLRRDTKMPKFVILASHEKKELLSHTHAHKNTHKNIVTPVRVVSHNENFNVSVASHPTENSV